MASLARAGRGSVRRAASANQIGWALREIASSRSELTARNAQLKVTFNPKSVLQYRLLGHEAKDWAGLLPGPTQTDFHDGQSATVLYEVRLAPSGPKDMATAELTWYPAGYDGTQGAQQQRLTHTLDRDALATSWASAAPPLQEAAIAAQTAEVLRRSPLVVARNQRAALVRISDRTATVSSSLNQRPSFSALVSLVEQAIHAKSSPRGARRP
jgi:hypothetical protein